jgi:beta-glucosidase
MPLLFGIHSVHGANVVVHADIFPQQISIAATLNPALAERVAAGAGCDMRWAGVHQLLAPVSDLSAGSSAVWSRRWETFGEDPGLAGELAAACVRDVEVGIRLRSIHGTSLRRRSVFWEVRRSRGGIGRRR